MNDKNPKQRGLLRLFLSYFKPHRKLFLLDISCAVMISLIDLAYPMVSRMAMYDLLPNRMFGTFFTVMAIVFLAFGLRAVFQYIIGYWGHTFGIRVEADIRRDLYRHFQDQGFEYFDRNRTGQLMSRLTSDLFELTELAHHGPEDLLTSAMTIAGALIVMFTIEWRLALVVDSAHLPGRHHAPAPCHARRLPGGQAEDRRHQHGHRVRPLRHPDGQGLRQRGHGVREVRHLQ